VGASMNHGRKSRPISARSCGTRRERLFLAFLIIFMAVNGPRATHGEGVYGTAYSTPVEVQDRPARAREISSSPEMSAIDSLAALVSGQSRKVLAENVARMIRRWSELETRLPSAADVPLLVREWRNEVKRATDCFTETLDAAAMGERDAGQRVGACLQPARNAESLSPALRAIAQEENSAVLAVTSVACECDLAACEDMNVLVDSLLASDPTLPIARFDDINWPELAEAWDLCEAPTWVFLGPEGNPHFLLEGQTERLTVLADIRTWLGLCDRSPEEK
jgi:hypothetical protein